MLVVAGIDYSLTSPAITVFNGNEWDYKKCKFYYFTSKEKNLVTLDPFYGIIYSEYKSDLDRYNMLSDWALNIIIEHKVDQVFIEGYAFSASAGRVFHIAENGGILKYKLWKQGIKTTLFAPSEIKKFATGKGNSNKENMCNQFLEETGIDVRKELNITNNNQWNPISDIVDSYYIAKCGFEKENNNENYS